VYAELQRTSEVIQADAGAPILFRPPYGNFNRQVQAIGASLGISTILWNVHPRDWSRPGVNSIIQRVLDTTHNGAIVQMHDGDGNRLQTVVSLTTIIATLEQRGFQFVTIQHMIKKLPPERTVINHISPDQFSPESVVTPDL
jgi:peptidoglycan-N-acetylglucosamine deacetylase